MLRHKGHFLGDAWYFAEADLVHAYYLTTPLTGKRHVGWHIAHATSRDLVDWDLHGEILTPGASGAWDDGGLATGSVIEAAGRYYMAYTGSPRAETGLAVSDDLFHWEKETNNPIAGLDERWYESIGTGLQKKKHWRDPFLIFHEGFWYQLTCASDRRAPDGIRGAVGLVRSVDLKTWEAREPLAVEPFCQEMECPQIYYRNGLYYLVFSALADQICEAGRRAVGEMEVWWTTYVMLSDSFFGPYRLAPRPRLVPRSRPVQPYACQVVHFQGRDYYLGTVWDFGGVNDFISDPVEVHYSEEGICVKS